MAPGHVEQAGDQTRAHAGDAIGGRVGQPAAHGTGPLRPGIGDDAGSDRLIEAEAGQGLAQASLFVVAATRHPWQRSAHLLVDRHSQISVDPTHFLHEVDLALEVGAEGGYDDVESVPDPIADLAAESFEDGTAARAV